MLYNKEIAQTTAELLLKIKAVKLSPAEPFTWASGIKSPIYCDNRVTLSYPEIRTFIRQHFVRAIAENFPEPELIAGVATAGIAQGALVAQEMGLPFAYVRAGKKDHGLTNQIEGEVRPGQNVVVIEDLISTGSSSLTVAQALKDAGCRVAGMVAIFTYDLPKARKAFDEASCRLITLTDFDTLVTRAVETGYLKEEEVRILKDFKLSLS